MLMKANSFYEMNNEELNNKVAELKAELFNLRFKHATNQLSNPMTMVECKKDIARAKTVYVNELIASYMGGGFSENKANRKLSKAEHTEIVENYMPHSHVVSYRWKMRLSFAGLRGILAKSPLTSGLYNRIKSKIYSGN